MYLLLYWVSSWIGPVHSVAEILPVTLHLPSAYLLICYLIYSILFIHLLLEFFFFFFYYVEFLLGIRHSASLLGITNVACSFLKGIKVEALRIKKKKKTTVMQRRVWWLKGWTFPAGMAGEGWEVMDGGRPVMSVYQRSLVEGVLWLS